MNEFEVQANNLVLRQIPFPIMAMHIFKYLSSVVVNPTAIIGPASLCQVTTKQTSDGKPGTTQYKIVHSMIKLNC